MSRYGCLCHSARVPGSYILLHISHQDWALEQKKDTAISRVISTVKVGRCPSYRIRQHEDKGSVLVTSLGSVDLKGLCNRKQKVNGAASYELILPQSYRQGVLEGLHEATGHVEVDRTRI